MSKCQGTSVCFPHTNSFRAHHSHEGSNSVPLSTVLSRTYTDWHIICLQIFVDLIKEPSSEQASLSPFYRGGKKPETVNTLLKIHTNATRTQMYKSKGRMLPIFLRCLTVTYFPESNSAPSEAECQEFEMKQNCKS